MTRAVSSAIQAKLDAKETLYGLFELTIDGTTHRYGMGGYTSKSQGVYQPMVVTADSIEIGAADRNSYTLPRPVAKVTLRDDDDRTLTKLVAGSGRRSIQGATGRYYWAAPDVAFADWLTVFEGVVGRPARLSDLNYQFTLRIDDRALQSGVNIPPITKYDWSFVHVSALGASAKVIYGVHNSAGTVALGMISTLYVDTSAFRFLVSFGRIQDVTAVWLDGVAQASGWSKEYVERNGRWYTVVKFTSDPGATATVNVDVEGFETDGDGSSGTLIEEPVAQLEHFLTNFAFGEWTSGSWLAASARLHSASLTTSKAYFNDKEIRGSRVIEASKTGESVKTSGTVMNQWCAQWRVPSFWSLDGKLGVLVFDHRSSNYITSPHFRQDRSPKPNLLPLSYREETADEVLVSWFFSEADGAFIQSPLHVTDESVVRGQTVSHPFSWRKAAL